MEDSLFRRSSLQAVLLLVEVRLLLLDVVQVEILQKVEQLKELLQLVEELLLHEVEDSNMRAQALFYYLFERKEFRCLKKDFLVQSLVQVRKTMLNYLHKEKIGSLQLK